MSFDIFGTLIDWETGIWDAVQASPIAPYVPERKKTMQLFMKYDHEVQSESPTMLQRDVIAEGFRRTAHELGLVRTGKISQHDLDQAAVVYGNSIGGYEAFPDTIDAIQRLAKHFKLIPLTNVDKQSFSRTLDNGLKGCHFDAIYTAEDIGSYKPSLRNFTYLEEHLQQDFGIARDQLCHTAQSLFHDQLPAKDFGLKYHVWIDRQAAFNTLSKQEYDQYDITMRFNTLAELADVVDKAFETS